MENENILYVDFINKRRISKDEWGYCYGENEHFVHEISKEIEETYDKIIKDYFSSIKP